MVAIKMLVDRLILTTRLLMPGGATVVNLDTNLHQPRVSVHKSLMLGIINVF